MIREGHSLKQEYFNTLEGRVITREEMEEECTIIEDDDCQQALIKMQKNYPDGDYSLQCRGQEFRDQSDIIIDKIVEELLKDISLEDKKRVVVALPWRSALAFVSSFKRAGIDNFYHLDIKRDEETDVPTLKTEHGKINKDSLVIVADPMLATGGSAVDTIKRIKEKGVTPDNITMVAVVSAPVGIAKLRQEGVEVITAFLHDKLNENAYIVPGLGDYGDKYFDGMREDDFKEFITKTVGLSLEEESGRKLLNRFLRHLE